MSLRGRIRNGLVVLDSPTDLPEGAEVEVLPVCSNGQSQTADDATEAASTRPATLYERYEGIIGIAEELPVDFAANHDHYIHGTPKRDE